MRGRASRRLAALAAQVDGGAPFYVRRPIPPGLRRSFPAEGWYWVPAGHHVAVFLAATEAEAYLELSERILAQEEADAG